MDSITDPASRGQWSFLLEPNQRFHTKRREIRAQTVMECLTTELLSKRTASSAGWLKSKVKVSDCRDYVDMVLTCEGDYYDPDFPLKLNSFNQKLLQILHADKEKLIIKKVEPWNSVKVTLNIPKEAAVRLKALAEEGSEALRSIGVLAVQVEGDRLISMTLTGRDDQTTLVNFGSSPCHGTDHALPTISSPALQQKSPVTTLLSTHFLKPKPVEMPVTMVRSNGGIELSQAFSNGIPLSCHPTIAPKLNATSTAAVRQSGHVGPAVSISSTLDAVVAAAVAMAPRSSLTCTTRQPVNTKNNTPKAKRIRKREPVPNCKMAVNPDVSPNSANADTKAIDRSEMHTDASIHLPPACTTRLVTHAGSAGCDGTANVTAVPVGSSQNGCTQHSHRSLLEPGKGEVVSANESIKAINDIITSLSAAPSHHVLVHHQTLRAVNKNNNVHSTTHPILSSMTAMAAFAPPCSSRSQTSVIVKDSSTRLASSGSTLNGHGSDIAGSGGEVALHVDVAAADQGTENATVLIPRFLPDLGSGTAMNINPIPVSQQVLASSATEGICIVAVQPDSKAVSLSLSTLTTNKLLVHSDKSDAGTPVIRSIECNTGKSARLLANCALQAAVSSHPSSLATGLARAVSGSGAATTLESLPPCMDPVAAAALTDVQQTWTSYSAIGGSKLAQAFHRDTAREHRTCDTRPAPVAAAIKGPNQSLLVKKSVHPELHAQHRSMVVTLATAASAAAIATASTSNPIVHLMNLKTIRTVELAASAAAETKAITGLTRQRGDGTGIPGESVDVASSNYNHSSLSSIGTVGPVIASVLSPEISAPRCLMGNGEDQPSQSTCHLEARELDNLKSCLPSDLQLKDLALNATLEHDPLAARGNRHSDHCDGTSLDLPLSSGTPALSGGDPAMGTAATGRSLSDSDSHTMILEQLHPLPEQLHPLPEQLPPLHEQNQSCSRAASISKADFTGTPDSTVLRTSSVEDKNPVTAQCVLLFDALPDGEQRQSCAYAFSGPVSPRRCPRMLNGDQGTNVSCSMSETNGDRATPDQEAPLDLSPPTRPPMQSSQLFLHTVKDTDKDSIRMNGLTCSGSVAVKLLPKLENEHDSSVTCSSYITNGAATSPEREAHSLSGRCLQLPANSADARRASSESVESGISLDECSSEMITGTEAGKSSLSLPRTVTDQLIDGMDPGDSTERDGCSTVLLAAQPSLPVAIDRPPQRSTPGRGRPRGSAKRSYLLTIESNSAQVILGDVDMDASRLGISETDNGEPKLKSRRGRKAQECPKNGLLLSSMSAAHFEPAKRATRSHGAADLQALPTVYRERRKPLKDKK